MRRIISNVIFKGLFFHASYFLYHASSYTLHMYIHYIIKKPKYFKQPDNNKDYNDYVKDIFDFRIHRDISVNEPKKDTYNN